MIRKAGIALMATTLAACGGTSAPERVVEPRADAAPAPRGAALRRQLKLTRHNDARHAVGVASLVWDDGLAAHALGYARDLARTRRFEHAPQPMGPGREGENLFTGTRDAYSYAEMIQYWIDERKWFVNRPAPDFSTTGNGEAVAHYTQIVWRTTTRVGCAVASNDRDDYLVCRYAPPGNVIGLKAL
ncbi:MAG: CAP domain-containing protein [Sphingomonas sp.]|uniref:CAP domain-containing protein n=1 Tax=Sphingomonas sp. TaxID=28214 RepID=UPI003F7F7734